MKQGAARHFVIAFLLALFLYITTYSFIEHMRQRKGGWQVTFASDSSGKPFVTVVQNALGIIDLQLRFAGEEIAVTNLQHTIIFDRPSTNAPFGQIIFIDTTFLPGTITFDFFGHEVELLPRVLIVNKQEVPWRSSRSIELRPEEKLPMEVRKRQRKVTN